MVVVSVSTVSFCVLDRGTAVVSLSFVVGSPPESAASEGRLSEATDMEVAVMMGERGQEKAQGISEPSRWSHRSVQSRGEW